MNDEKQLILEMLKEGKITVEEANDLLSAIGNKKGRNDSDFMARINQSIESVIKKTTDAFESLSNIDLENIDINQYNIKGQVNTNKEMRIDDEINNINIDIPSGKILIERANDSAITINQDIWSKKGELLDYLDIEIIEDDLNISVNEAYHNLEATSIIKIALGKNLYENLNINLVNGNIEIEDVDFTDTSINSINAKVNVINSQGDIDIQNTNGKVDIKNTNGDLTIDNVNGSIYLANISGEKAEIDAVSGNIRVDGLNTKNLFADTDSGNIRIYNIKESEKIDLNSGFGNIVIDSESYAGEIKAEVLSQGLNLSDKFKNKMQKEKGYEVSTNLEKTDIEIFASAAFGKINLR
ncbi:DUF4097 family beta strand repeat-containing protein [uncultured Anaerococcus sp.]|uniref:DUF4097 family beta strand repeat-containing protein n=1 Tax=uncultured Anaerococcus sp. TaxID=293428 RepID=UPI0025F3CBAA|nr:DUF4097 family beta strand repeat-containing protein [uncultured Anaerococcus sp.]